MSRKHKKKKNKKLKENIFENINIKNKGDLKFSDVFRLKIKGDKQC